MRYVWIAAMALSSTAYGQDTLEIPGLTPELGPKRAPASCEITGDAESCVRVLACFGTQGLWFDGQARGWNAGVLFGQLNDGSTCQGSWGADTGPLGSGTAQFECSDGSRGRVIYYTQDGQTGTAIARGMDSKGRHIRAWSGENVLQFLGSGDATVAKLPCAKEPIPIS